MRITVVCERARWLGRFRSGEIHVFDSTGNVERTIPFNEADREMWCVIKQREEGRDGPSAAVPEPHKPDILTIQPASIRVWRIVIYSNRTRYYAPGVGTIYILDLVRNGGYVWHY